MDPNLIMIVLLAAVLIFMFWSSRKRMAKMKTEQAEKARQMVPGVEVMLNGGLFGTIVSYNPDDLDQPAEIEIAPGVVIKTHSQSIARVVTPQEAEIEDYAAEVPDSLADMPENAPYAPEELGRPDPLDAPPAVETVEETRKRLEGDNKQD